MGSKDRKTTETRGKQRIDKCHFYDSLTCIYTNADSLSNKFDEFKNRIKIDQPHIIAVTEAKPKHFRYKIFKAEYSLENYEMYVKNIDNDSGRGIIVYIHRSIITNELYINYNVESLFLSVQLNSTNKLLFGCIYRTESQDNTDELCDLMRHVYTLDFSHYLIVGDFNYPHINWESGSTETNSTTSKEYKFMECIKDCFLYQHCKTPNRGRGSNKQTTLDLLLTNEEGMVNEVEVQSPIGKSDHSVLKFQFNCFVPYTLSNKETYMYHKANYEDMSKELVNINWVETLGKHEDIDMKWQTFTEVIHNLETKYVPKKKSKATHKKANVPLDRKCVDKIKKKHNLWKKYMKNKDGNIHEEYCRVRNQVKTMIKRARKKFEKESAMLIKENPKTAWKYIKSKFKIRDGVQNLRTDTTDINSPLTKTDSEKAEVLSEFFTSVFVKEPEGDIPQLEPRRIRHCMTKLNISEKDIKKKLDKLNSSKLPDLDKLHPHILKNL